MVDKQQLIDSLDHWTPALVRKYEEKAFEYMTALVDALRGEADTTTLDPAHCAERGHSGCEVRTINGELWTIHHPMPAVQPGPPRLRDREGGNEQ